ncbi:MAG: type 4a pilus biogenesis protein PilO [Gemmatimonadetes bacterium]|nr:type 4a pilus biogenesis protein PilO [Gemmatimonadota bacterium]
MAWYNPTDPKQRNAMVVAILLVALFYPFYSFWYKGHKAEVDDMQAHLERLQDNNRRAELTSARGGGRNLEQRMALYQRQVSKLEQLIPSAEDVPALVNSIAGYAIRSNVKLERLNPEPLEPAAYYTKSTYDVGAIGEYHDVGRFITEIASLPRIVSPVQMSVTLYSQAQLYPDYKSPVIATFQIETYVLPEPGTKAAAAKAGGSS